MGQRVLIKSTNIPTLLNLTLIIRNCYNEKKILCCRQPRWVLLFFKNMSASVLVLVFWWVSLCSSSMKRMKKVFFFQTFKSCFKQTKRKKWSGLSIDFQSRPFWQIFFDLLKKEKKVLMRTKPSKNTKKPFWQSNLSFSSVDYKFLVLK